MKDTKDNFQKLVLPNGLTVLLYWMDSIRSVYAELAIRVGAIHESDGEQGISHFVEHASLLGIRKYKTKLDIAKHAQQIGASFDGLTNKFATLFWVKLPYINIFDGLELIRGFVFEPILDRTEILKEKDVVLSEFNDFWGNPERRFWHEFWVGRFGIKDHPYSRRALGERESIEKFDEIKVKAWREKFYHPNSMILTITGNFKSDDVTKIVEKLFGEEKPGLKTKDPVFSKTDYSNFNIHVQDDERSQIVFGISFPAFGRKGSTRRERMTLGILSSVLSYGTGSRLFQRLRQKESLVYGISGGTTIYDWLGALEIDSSTSLENVLKVFDGIKNEVQELIVNGVTDEELDLARKFTNYSSLLRFDNPVDIAYYISDQEFDYKEIWFPERYIEESKKITKDDVNLMAKKVLDFSKINIGLLGNIPKEKILKVRKIFTPQY